MYAMSPGRRYFMDLHDDGLKPLLEDITDDSEQGLNIDMLDRKMRLVARRLDMNLRQVIALPRPLKAHHLRTVAA